MVEAPTLSDPERLLALNYVPLAQRRAVAVLWQLDEMLGKIVASTTEPMIGQMRLTWWFERLVALDAGEKAAEPLLSELSRVIAHHDVTGTAMADLIEGWESLLDPLPLSEPTLSLFAEKRGGGLFRLTGSVLSVPGNAASGAAWALVDFAGRCSDVETAERAIVMARNEPPVNRDLPKPLRILARLAQAKAQRPPAAIHRPLNRFVFLRAVLG